MSLTTMLVIALVGLLVVIFGGLALAVGLGPPRPDAGAAGRARGRFDAESDSTGTPDK